MESTEIALPPCMLPSISEPIGSCGSETTQVPIALSKCPCPWGKVTETETVSLTEVMSEQLASSLQIADNSASDSTMLPEEMVVAFPTEISDCSDDFVLAQTLQLEFDREHDTALRLKEKQYNGDSKVSVSFGKYLRLPDGNISDYDDEENEAALELNAKTHWYNFEQAQKTFKSVGRSGVSRQGNTTTTKHDPTVCGRLNACKLMEFPPGITTGDAGCFDMKLSNSAYNGLKSHSGAEIRRSHKLCDRKDRATSEHALDTKTRIIIFKLVNSQVLESLNGCFSTGKEACVYHAWGVPEDNKEAPEYAIKVYKTTLNEFQKRDQYIRDDYRFADRFGKQSSQKSIHMWAEKEMRNLKRIQKANIPCPEVVVLKDHMLVMTFIGRKMNPAPKLKHVKLPFEDMTIIYDQTFEIMKKMYKECMLIHADLSEYNLLWHKGLVWVIDVSQSVEITHPSANEFLMRDCQNISNFFEKQGVLNVIKPDEMFAEICGFKPPP